jgi:hypothetical protein
MDKKKVSAVFGIILLIIAILVIIFLTNSKTTELSCKTIDENGYCILEGVPEYLKLQEPVAIDEHELYNFSKSPFNEYFARIDLNNASKGFLCADKDAPYLYKTVYYFVKGCDDLSNIRENCPYRRAAILCNTFYVVEDYNPSGYGLTMYGPYEL